MAFQFLWYHHQHQNSFSSFQRVFVRKFLLLFFENGAGLPDSNGSIDYFCFQWYLLDIFSFCTFLIKYTGNKSVWLGLSPFVCCTYWNARARLVKLHVWFMSPLVCKLVFPIYYLPFALFRKLLSFVHWQLRLPAKHEIKGVPWWAILSYVLIVYHWTNVCFPVVTLFCFKVTSLLVNVLLNRSVCPFPWGWKDVVLNFEVLI